MDSDKLRSLVKTLINLKQKLKCAICLDVVTDVVELDCSHRYCSHCLNELKNREKNPLCPLCKRYIKKRCTVYKDLYADKLSYFISEACNIIKTEFGYEVDELNKDKSLIRQVTNKINVQNTDIIKNTAGVGNILKKSEDISHNVSAPVQDTIHKLAFNTVPTDENKKNEAKPASQEAFDQLLSSCNLRTYKNKQKSQSDFKKPQLHQFKDYNNKVRVIEWLNANETILNKITQSQKSMDNQFFAEELFDLPSISQIPARSKYKLRSHSLDIKTKKASEATLKRFNSLASNINDENYTIEEINTEKIERNVVQDLLEDACLANYERQYEKKERVSERVVSKGKGKSKKISKGTKQPSPVCSSGNDWDRIKNVSKSIKKVAKVPKQLNITLCSTSPVHQNKTKKAPTTTKVQVQKKIKKAEKTEVKQQTHGKKPNKQTFNLSTIEDYISSNINKVQIHNVSNTSADSLPLNPLPEVKDMTVKVVREDFHKQVTENNDQPVNEIFFMPTQKSTENGDNEEILPDLSKVKDRNDKIENNIVERESTKHLEHVEKNHATHAKLLKLPELQFPPQDYNSLEQIISDLHNNLDNYMSHIVLESDSVSKAFLCCFTNIKSYVTKMKDMNYEKSIKKASKSVQTVGCVMEHMQTQTVPCGSFQNKGTQTEQVEAITDTIKNILVADKNLEIQKGQSATVDLQLETNRLEPLKSTSVLFETIESVSSKKNYMKPKELPVAAGPVLGSSKANKIEHKDVYVPSISKKSQELSYRSKNRRQSNISLLNQTKSKDNLLQPSEAPNSPLVFSLEPNENEDPKKVNRKLSFNTTQSKRFKRIRMAGSDSDSDEEHFNKKTRRSKFVRDDLSIHFTETAMQEEASKESQERNMEDKNVEYDEYLDEILRKYDSPKSSPAKEPKSIIGSNIHNDDLNTICDKLVEQNRNKNYSTPIQKPSTSNTKKHPKSKELEEYEHVFSNDHIFSNKENLEKLERDICDDKSGGKHRNKNDIAAIQKPSTSNTKDHPKYKELEEYEHVFSNDHIFSNEENLEKLERDICDDKSVRKQRNKNDSPALQEPSTSSNKKNEKSKELEEYEHVFSNDHIFSNEENLEKLEKDMSKAEKLSKSKEDKHVFPRNVSHREDVDQFDKDISIGQKRRSPKDADEFEHAFSEDNIFSNIENLEKLDRDISQFQRNLVEDSVNFIENSLPPSQAAKRPKLSKTNIEDATKLVKKTLSGGKPNINSESLFGNTTVFNKEENNQNIARQKDADIIDNIQRDIDVFDDDNLDEELAQINITEVERKLEKNETKRRDKVKVLQDIQIKSKDKFKATQGKEEEYVISDSNDELFSDDDVVETTPQKKMDSKTRGILCNIADNFDTSFKVPAPTALLATEDVNLDVCLPPPPGFGDENDTNHSGDEVTVIDNTVKLLNKSSLTPDRLSQLCDNPVNTSKRDANRSRISDVENSPAHSQQSYSSLITPKKTSISRADLSLVHSTPHTQNINRDTLRLSPINKDKSPPTLLKDKPNLIEMAQKSKYSPLVTTTKSPLVKKHNIMTSLQNQKSILNYVRPSQEAKAAKKPCVAYTRIMSRNEVLVSRLKSADLVNVSATFGPHVTHMVVLVDEKGCVKAHTAKFVLAVAAGIWVVRLEWVEDCLRHQCILPEEPYEACDVSGIPGPKLSRLTRNSNPLLKGYKFYCAPPFSSISREDAENAIKMLGGETVPDLKELVKNRQCINVIVTDTTATDDTDMFEYWLEKYKVVTVDVEWLTKSISQYKIISIRPYVLCSDDSICDLGYPAQLIESVLLTFSENL